MLIKRPFIYKKNITAIGRIEASVVHPVSIVRLQLLLPETNAFTMRSQQRQREFI